MWFLIVGHVVSPSASWRAMHEAQIMFFSLALLTA